MTTLKNLPSKDWVMRSFTIFHIREFPIARSRTGNKFHQFSSKSERISLFRENARLRGFWYPCVRQGTGYTYRGDAKINERRFSIVVGEKRSLDKSDKRNLDPTVFTSHQLWIPFKIVKYVLKLISLTKIFFIFYDTSSFIISYFQRNLKSYDVKVIFICNKSYPHLSKIYPKLGVIVIISTHCSFSFFKVKKPTSTHLNIIHPCEVPPPLLKNRTFF